MKLFSGTTIEVPYTISRQTREWSGRQAECHLCGEIRPTITITNEFSDGPHSHDVIALHECSHERVCGAPLRGGGVGCQNLGKYSDGRCRHHSDDPEAQERRAKRRRSASKPPLGPYPVLPSEVAELRVRQAVAMRWVALALADLARPAR